MLFSIIITHYKTPDLLKLCLKSIQENTQNLPKEIFVVDSAADEETEEFIKNDFPEISYISFKKDVGFAKLVNAGLSGARGNYVLILNADMILTKGCLNKMVDYLSTRPEVGLLGPQLLNFDSTIQKSCFRFYRPQTIIYRRTFLGKSKRGQKHLNGFLMSDFDHQSVREVDWLMGTALLAKKEIIEKIGGMDERFFMYFEDVDWCRRFWKNNYKVIYYPEAKMYHYHGQNSKKTGGLTDLFLTKYTWIHLASAVKYFWKWRKDKIINKK